MKLRIEWDKKFFTNNLTVVSSARSRELVRNILNALHSGNLDPNDLLEIAQYDIGSKDFKNVSEIRRILKRVSKKLGYNHRRLERETSRTALFTALVCYAIHDLIERHDLHIVFEPQVINSRTGEALSFDYALVRTSGGKDTITLVVEVKRLWSLRNLPDYIADFNERLHSILQTTYDKPIGLVVLHLHFTKYLVKQHKDCVDSINKILNLSRRFTDPRSLLVHVIATRGTDFTRFKEGLTKQINYMVKGLG